MNDAQRFMKLQQDVLKSVMAAVQENVVGLPLGMVATYLRQMRGDVIVVGEGTTLKDIKDSKPFRLVVTITERIDLLKAKKDIVVDQVIGWR